MSLGGRHSRQREQGPRLGDREAGWKWFNVGSVLELREQEVSQRGESETTQPAGGAQSAYSSKSDREPRGL